MELMDAGAMVVTAEGMADEDSVGLLSVEAAVGLIA